MATFNIEIFIGAPVEHASERTALKHIVARLQVLQLDAVLLVNFHINAVQIDLVIGLKEQLIIVEVKGSVAQLQGDYNGNWQIRTPTGEWKPTRNYYEQTLHARHAVRDAVSARQTGSTGYPEALLLFTPKLHPQSSVIVGDHKVTVSNLDALSDFKSLKKTPGLNLANCQKLAIGLGLQKVANLEAAISLEHNLIEKQLIAYGRQYRSSYSEALDGLIDFPFLLGDKEVSISEIKDDTLFQSNLHIIGPSGCGKSLLAQCLGSVGLSYRFIPIYIQALHFEDLLGPMMDAEVKLLGYPSAAKLLSDRGKTRFDVIVVLDGINECTPEKRARLVRCMKAMCDRFLVRTILVSQKSDGLAANLKCQVAEVKLPDVTLKEKIAGTVVDDETLALIRPLLQIVETGMEARVAGELGKDGAGTLSKFGLLDLFTRKKLGHGSAKGIRALDTLADYLFKQLSFSLTERVAERVFQDSGIDPIIINELVASGIMRRYTDRLSFRHEIFLNNYIAESIVLSAGDSSAILTALVAPVNFSRKSLILGAIDDDRMLSVILPAVTDNELIVACYLGECGRFAQHWVKEQFSTVFFLIKAEAANVLFEDGDIGLWAAKVQPGRQRNWSASELAFIDAVPLLFQHGFFFDEVWQMLSSMDRRLSSLLPTLFKEGMKRSEKRDLNDGLFACTYLSMTPSPPLAFTRIVKAIQGYSSFWKGTRRFLEPLKVYLTGSPPQSFGQVYLLTSFFKYGPDAKLLYPYIFEFLRDKWWVAPYHLKLDVCWSIGQCWNNDDERQTLIDCLNELSSHYNSIPSTIFEALQALGATEDDELNFQEVTKQEISTCLANRDNPEYWPQAYSIYYKQMDHPYGGAYSIQLDALDEADLRDFMLMALKGSSTDMFVKSLITRLHNYGTVDDCVYLEKFRVPPEEMGGFAQERIEPFFITHVVMGQMGYPMVSLLGTYESELANTLCALAEILFHLNSRDSDLTISKKNCQPAIAFLKNGDSKFVLDGIYQADRSVRDYNLDDTTRVYLQRSLTDVVAFFCRKALSNPQIQKSIIYAWDKPDEILLHAIHMLENVGNVTDLPRLKLLANHPILGKSALETLRKLEGIIS